MKTTSIIKNVLHFKKIGRYIIDIYIRNIQQEIWKNRNFKLGKSNIWAGFPIINQFHGSVIKIGSNCLIISRSIDTALGVSHKTIFRTLSNNSELIIGDNVRMSGTTFCSDKKITIGDRCVIGSDVIIADTDFHSLNHLIRSSPNDSLNSASIPIKIGNDVFIGTRSIILKGVSLGDRVIVGAGSIVTRSFPNDSIIAGNPAKVIAKSQNFEL